MLRRDTKGEWDRAGSGAIGPARQRDDERVNGSARTERHRARRANRWRDGGQRLRTRARTHRAVTAIPGPHGG